MNSYLPGMICNKYRNSKIVAFSTGNVYPLTPLGGQGAKEADPTGPVGDYAMSCLGRERIFDHFSRQWEIPVSILRLNYAIAIRYGVLVDIAKKVWSGVPVSVEMGAANVIWQGDANAMALQSFDHVSSPPFVVNIAGSDQISTRETAMKFGELMGKTPVIEGEEASYALLSNAEFAIRMFGSVRIGVEQMMVWVANWVMSGGDYLGKPTQFEVRDGRF